MNRLSYATAVLSLALTTGCSSEFALAGDGGDAGLTGDASTPSPGQTGDASPGHPLSDDATPGILPDGTARETGGGQGDDDATAEDANTGDTGQPSVRCGPDSLGLSCDSATQVCCSTARSSNSFTYACVAQSASCAGLAIACARARDCASGEVCCDAEVNHVERVSCVPETACNGRLLCESGDCPRGMQCQPYGNSIPYSVCRQSDQVVDIR